MGENINLVKLIDERINKDLVAECDGFHTFNEKEIYSFFGEQLKPKNK